ncbi:MAG: type IV pilus twitching motility protein PilT [Patescibacteria group bacterium]|nr:type IV pilus twitching motility protein PilT [Patescibacteria group bacterium]
MNIYDLLEQLVQLEGSDLHIIVGCQPYFRVGGKLVPVENSPILGPEDAEALIKPLMTQEQQKYVEVNKELDFGYQFKDKGRFRTNAYHTKGNLAAALRLIPSKIKTLEELNVPEQLHRFGQWRQGLVLVTGPTGEGKSSTLAAIIDEINQQRAEHIVTIEDPIEFVYEPKKSIISQRELNHDTENWTIALRSVLREDPDIVLVGEMRDFETISSAITVAETGHLVFATLHTATAAQTMDRIIDVFPSHQQGQIRQQLAATIKAVASQRLLPTPEGGRIPAMELMFANGAVRNLIREGKTHQIDNAIQTAAAEGMMLIETHLAQLVQQGVITEEVGMTQAFRPNELARLLGRQ